jgi:NTE family protein
MKLPYDNVALLLQGGGALGAYQAGVFEGLAAGGIEPNWVAGISIGALNSALIAGNAPEQRVARLRDFWETICQPAFGAPSAPWMQSTAERVGGRARSSLNAWEALRAVTEGQRGFFVPRFPPPWWAPEQAVGSLSWYDVGPLKTTLERLVDFERLNSGGMRVTVSAVNVATGNFERFDNTRGKWKGKLRAEHFMASGALPPGFPAIEIDGKHYWDGGLVSNTPLAEVLDETPRLDTLAFQVDLWSARGPLPKNLFDVEERQKDIRFSSRTRVVTDMVAREQKLRSLLREVLAKVPAAERKDCPWCAEAEVQACDRRLNIVHLIYRDKEWDGLSKDYEFGPLTMREHWASGLDDVKKTLAHADWLERPDKKSAVVTHDVHRGNGASAPAGRSAR